MKLSLVSNVTLVAISLFPFLMAQEENVTDISYNACQILETGLKEFKNELSSSGCRLDVETDNLSVNDLPSEGRFYRKYYSICSTLCDCPQARGLSAEEQDQRHRREGRVSDYDKDLKTEGECDASLKALDAIDENALVQAEDDCVTTTTSSLYRFFCEDPQGNPFESICAGYYEYNCCLHAKCERIVNTDNGDRLLEEIKNMSMEDVMERITNARADPDGVYAKKYNVLPEDVCRTAVNFMDKRSDEDIHTPPQFRGKRKELRFSGQDFVDLVGKDNARELLDFFHGSLGNEAPVTSITIHRTDTENDGKFTAISKHIDHHDALIVYLQSSAGVYHYTRDGLMATEEVTPGLAVVHGKHVLHHTKPFTGNRYFLEIASDPSVKDADCMLSNLLH